MATLTLTLSSQDQADLNEAVGDALNLAGSASDAQSKAFEIVRLKEFVRAYKRKKGNAALVITDISPS